MVLPHVVGFCNINILYYFIVGNGLARSAIFSRSNPLPYG